MSDLWSIGIPATEKVVRTVAIYGGLAVLLRVAGKRNLAQLNSFDLVVVLLLSNVVQNAIIGLDDSLTGGLLGAVVLLAVNAVVVRIVNRSDAAVRAFEGDDITLVKDGSFVDESLRREGLRRADVEAALRAQNADGAADVAEATLSPGGSIVVWLKPDRMNATRGDVATIESRLAAVERLLEAIAEVGVPGPQPTTRRAGSARRIRWPAHRLRVRRSDSPLMVASEAATVASHLRATTPHHQVPSRHRSAPISPS
jgi:uncharacterized membrane protein YcaP (DUF421 family)